MSVAELVTSILTKVVLSKKNLDIFTSKKALGFYVMGLTYKQYDFHEWMGDLIVNPAAFHYTMKRYPSVVSNKWIVGISFKYLSTYSLSRIGYIVGIDNHLRANNLIKEKVRTKTNEGEHIVEDLMEAFIGVTYMIAVAHFGDGVAFQFAQNLMYALFDLIDFNITQESIFSAKERFKLLADSQNWEMSKIITSTRDGISIRVRDSPRIVLLSKMSRSDSAKFREIFYKDAIQKLRTLRVTIIESPLDGGQGIYTLRATYDHQNWPKFDSLLVDYPKATYKDRFRLVLYAPRPGYNRNVIEISHGKNPEMVYRNAINDLRTSKNHPGWGIKFVEDSPYDSPIEHENVEFEPYNWDDFEKWLTSVLDMFPIAQDVKERLIDIHIIKFRKALTDSTYSNVSNSKTFIGMGQKIYEVVIMTYLRREFPEMVSDHFLSDAKQIIVTHLIDFFIGKNLKIDSQLRSRKLIKDDTIRRGFLGFLGALYIALTKEAGEGAALSIAILIIMPYLRIYATDIIKGNVNVFKLVGEYYKSQGTSIKSKETTKHADDGSFSISIRDPTGRRVLFEGTSIHQRTLVLKSRYEVAKKLNLLETVYKYVNQLGLLEK